MHGHVQYSAWLYALHCTHGHCKYRIDVTIIMRTKSRAQHVVHAGDEILAMLCWCRHRAVLMPLMRRSGSFSASTMHTAMLMYNESVLTNSWFARLVYVLMLAKSVDVPITLGSNGCLVSHQCYNVSLGIVL